MMMNNTTNIQF